MKPKKNVSYFPVTAHEQALLVRVREQDLNSRLDDLVEMLDQIADARLTSADLEQAIQLLVASRQGEALDARFDNLEARLRERIEKGLSEIEGRLSRRMGGGVVPPVAPVVASLAAPKAVSASKQAPAAPDELPKEASIAFRIGGELVWGPSAAQFYVAVWRWLFVHGHVRATDLPIQSGKARYVVAAEPVHPSGKEFTRADQPVPGVYVELNLSRGDIIQRSKKYLGEHGVAFDVVVGSE
jgi:hypothetical protein